MAWLLATVSAGEFMCGELLAPLGVPATIACGNAPGRSVTVRVRILLGLCLNRALS